MFKTYYFAKILKKIHIPSFRHCVIDSTAKVASGSELAYVTLGRYSYVGNYTHITDAVIGNFCSIGDNCSIGGGMHPMNYVSTSPVFLQGKNILHKNFAHIPYDSSLTVTIENDVWIGDGAFIKSGVKVGSGAIIGAHSVVTHDVDPYSIVAGVPAKEIRKRFDDDIVEILMNLQWWDWSDSKMNKMSHLFLDP